jgi:hypothetical protein
MRILAIGEKTGGDRPREHCNYRFNPGCGLFHVQLFEVIVRFVNIGGIVDHYIVLFKQKIIPHWITGERGIGRHLGLTLSKICFIAMLVTLSKFNK